MNDVTSFLIFVLNTFFQSFTQVLFHLVKFLPLLTFLEASDTLNKRPKHIFDKKVFKD